MTSNFSKLLIAICTYDEINNLPLLYKALRETFATASILVVDDNSPDGTGKWCDQTAKQDPRFFVIHRKQKSGLGSATITAFEFAINKQYEFIMTMDGDRSHSPNQAQAVLQKLLERDENQISIGSRYIRGGKIENWPLQRHLMSGSINTYSRLLIGLSIRDCSSAFRCYRVSFLAKIDLGAIEGMGYAYLEEILWWGKCLGAQMAETPITFGNRVEGKSKINFAEAVHALWIIFRIGVKRLLRIGIPKPRQQT
ncbi:MAG: polyprenol monophosphomannose synthase [Planctomycetota bacterium]|nr:polyprenol monophosphomannose synthase [Planctomycetota bacterium]